MRKHTDAARGWHGLVQQQQALDLELCHDREARHVAARPGEALGQPSGDRVVAYEEYDGHSRGGCLSCLCGKSSDNDDDVRPCCNCFTRKLLDAIDWAVMRGDDEIAALDEAEPGKLRQRYATEPLDRYCRDR